MNQDDMRVYAMLMRFVLQQAEAQSLLVRVFLSRFDNLDKLQILRDQLSRMDDDDAAGQIRERLDAQVREAALKQAPLSRSLLDSLARSESDHEKIEHLLTQLEKTLGT